MDTHLKDEANGRVVDGKRALKMSNSDGLHDERGNHDDRGKAMTDELAAIKRWLLVLFVILLVCSSPIGFCAPLGATRVLGSQISEAEAQTSIVVGPNVLVSDDSSGVHYEPFLAADSSEENSQRMLASAFVALAGTNRSVPALYRTDDGGSSWVDSLLPETQKTESAANFQVAFDRHGTAYVVGIMLGFRPAFKDEQPQKQGIYFHRSVDGGETWQPAVYLGFDDYPQLLVDSTTGRYADRIYIWARHGLYRSENGGRSFIGPVRPPQGAEPEFNDSNVDPALIFRDGCLFLPRREWPQSPEANTGETQKDGMAFATSCDGGVSLSPLTHVQYQIWPGNNRNFAMVRDRRIDAGSSFPKYAIDPKSDRLYVVWGDFRFGQPRVLFSSSQDRGKDWSDPVQISARVPAGSSQYQPSIAVNDEGIVAIQWFDTRDSLNGDSYNLYFTVSKNGGQSFEEPVRVSNGSSYPRRPENQRALCNQSESGHVVCGFSFCRWPDDGDYMGLTADRHGVFHPLWADSRSGAYQLYTATVFVPSENQRSSLARPKTKEADVSKLLALRYDPVQYDSAKEEFIIPVRLYNTSKETVYGPIHIEVTAINGNTKGDAILDAPNGKRDVGAVFDYSKALRDLAGLAPGGVTEAIPWRIEYNDWSREQLQLDVKIEGFVSE
jgi:hypothetical protein